MEKLKGVSMKEYDEDDPLSGGRMLANGILAGVISWAIIYAIYFVLSR
jgi:hypothetical protein